MTNPDFSDNILWIIRNPSFIARKYLLQWIRKYAPELNWIILDVWCWSKPYIDFFSYKKYIWVDVEISWHDHSNESIDVYYDWRSLPFEDDSIDSVLSTQTFEHIQYLPEVVWEIHRVTKKWWKILITLPFVWGEHEQPYDFRRYTAFWVTHLLQEAWFEILNLDKSTNTILTITQLLSTYLSKIFRTTPKIFRNILQLLIIFPSNAIWILFAKVLPIDDDLYLDNIILAKKI